MREGLAAPRSRMNLEFTKNQKFKMWEDTVGTGKGDKYLS